MSTTAYTTRPLKSALLVAARDGVVKIATLRGLPNGSYVVFAKLIVVTRVDETGADSARADLSLQAVGGVDRAMTTLWHSSDRGSLQPADTVSLQLPIRFVRRGKAGAPPPTSSVALFCTSILGILEIIDVVITAIKVGSIKTMS